MSLQPLYDRCPYWVQHLMLNCYAFGVHRERYGAPFRRACAALEETQWFTRAQIEEYQSRRFVDVVRHAYETVPHYRRTFAEYGFRPSDVKDIRDAAKLPLLSRDDVRLRGRDMISSRCRMRDLVHGHTSGTTGSPLGFYWDKETCVLTNAVDWREKNWGGVRLGDRIALFLGRTIVPTAKKRPPFWQLDRLHSQLWMSSFHMSEEFLPSYLERLRSFRPAAIEGYPSTVYIVARFLKAKGETFPVRAVYTSSETLLPLQRELIEERFQAPVFDFLGMAERVIYAGQCAENHSYHLSFEYAFNEIVDSSGKPCAEGEKGFVVGTSLVNRGMPFIRYRTNDVSAIHWKRCECGRDMPVLDAVTTKQEDIVVTPEGRLVSSSVLTHPFKPLDSVAESQIIQEELGRLRVLIVKRPEYEEADSERLVSALRERVGEGMKIELEFVDSIPRTAAGKLRWVISKVPLPL